MNRIVTFSIVVLMFALFFVPISFAQQGLEPESFQAPQDMPEPTAPPEIPAQEAIAFKASELIGYQVQNLEGEQLGRIEEIVIDLQEGRVAYVALSYGSMLGFGGKFFAVPWEALTLLPEDQVVRLNINEEELEHDPGFDKDNWPVAPDPRWGSAAPTHGWE